MARLLGACEYTARHMGGSMARAILPGDDDEFAAAVRALDKGGMPAAAAVFRKLDAYTRSRVLDMILDYWLRPVTALRIALDDEMIQQARPRD
jgi:hypothetical protein